MREHRQFFRITIERPGQLRHGLQTIECEVLDLTEKGLQVRTEVAVQVGELVQLDCLLEEHLPFRCALVVTYIRPPYVGGRIVSITQEHHRRLSQYVERHIVQHLVGL